MAIRYLTEKTYPNVAEEEKLKVTRDKYVCKVLVVIHGTFAIDLSEGSYFAICLKAGLVKHA